MKKLYTAALEKFFLRFGLPSKNREELVDSIAKTFGNDITYSKLVRLPTSEVKIMLKTPCPTIQEPSAEANQNQLIIFKRLRHNYKIDEVSTCIKCPRADRCPLKAVGFKDLTVQSKVSNKAALHDFLFFFLSLEGQEEDSYSQMRWSAAYKTISSFGVLISNFSILSRESLLFREVLKHYDHEERQLMEQRKRPEVVEKDQIKDALRGRTIRLDPHPSFLHQDPTKGDSAK